MVATMNNGGIDLRDQLSIDTPELVGIELPLAGIGSRCLALVVDSMVQGFCAFALFMLALLLIAMLPAITPVKHSAASSIDPAKWAVALLIFVPFLLQWGYFTLFEAFWNGQTPGKKVLNLRVIQKSGRPIGLFESMARNLIRMIDMLPGFYAVGAACIFATRRQQRLGDMVAGTLAVHSIPVEKPMLPDGTRTFTAAAFQPAFRPAPVNTLALPADAVARLSSDDLQLLENFLGRRLDLPIEVRTKLAAKLAQTMAAKMLLDVPPGTSNETFLEALVLGLREAGGNPVA
jgi:uncharacterized RDD family membrane protein YckC